MNETEITRLIRREIREPSTKRVGTADITQSIATAVNILGGILVGANPSYFNKRVSLSSNTHVFSKPSNVHVLNIVRDLGCNAVSISGVDDNGSTLIRITTDGDHGFSTGEIITHHDIEGTTEANDTFKITVIDDTHYDLVGSTFANTYTSGGKAFKENTFNQIKRRPENYSDSLSYDKWFPKNDNIVVDYPFFTNDILIEYTFLPSTINEIPDRFHFGIVSYGVTDLILIPQKEKEDLAARRKHHASQWQLCVSLAMDFKLSTESSNISDEKGAKRFI